MALGKQSTALFARGLGTLRLKEKSPALATSYDDVGYLAETEINVTPDMENIVAETGQVVDVLEKSRVVTLATTLMQSGKLEIDVPRLASGKIWAAQYRGKLDAAGSKWQYWFFPTAKINPGVVLKFALGMRGVPVLITAMKDNDQIYDVPEYAFIEGNAEMFVDAVQLWIEPAVSLNVGTNKVLDISGFDHHGDIGAAYATVWNAAATPTPEMFFRFAAATTNDVSFGDVLDDDGTGDFLIEAWIRPQCADGTVMNIITKKAVLGDTTAGYAVYRDSSNRICLTHGDGDSFVTVTSAGTCLQNVWKHIAVAVDRNGNGQAYINGAASGAAVDISAQTSGTNALPLYVSRVGTNYTQCDFGGVRIHRWAAAGLPSDIATIILNHYTAHRANYGV